MCIIVRERERERERYIMMIVTDSHKLSHVKNIYKYS